MSDTSQGSDVSFLLPIFLQMGDSLTAINAKLTSTLTKFDAVIALAEGVDPGLPELALLRQRRQNTRAMQRTVLAVDVWAEDEQLQMEDGYAAQNGLGTLLAGESG